MRSPTPLLDHEDFDLRPHEPLTIPSGQPQKAARYVGSLFRVLADEVNAGGVAALDYTKPVVVSCGEPVVVPSGVTAAEKLRGVKSLIVRSVFAHFDERDSWIWMRGRVPAVGFGDTPTQEQIGEEMNLSRPQVGKIIRDGDTLLAAQLERQHWRI